MEAVLRPLGIIAALPEEVRHLGQALAVDDKTVRGGFAFRQGRLDDAPVVLVEAGIGKVNTALVGTILLDHFGCRGVLLTGVAGGLDSALGIGDVVVAEELVQHDYGAVVGGEIKPYRPGVPPIGASEEPLGYALDPSIAPGTGTPEIGGITTREAQGMVRMLDGVDIIGADLVEVSPPLDPTNATALAGATMMFELLCVMAGSRPG